MSFSERSVEFLRENRRKNNREWYLTHKEDYNKFVLAPMIAMVENLTPTMLKIDKDFITEAKVDKTISRVYRDTRFSKDKSLYRENSWCTFAKDKKIYDCPAGFYFGIDHDNFSYGFGYYNAPTSHIAALRKMILARSQDFISSLKCYEEQDTFLIAGDSYKRSKYPLEPENIREWLDKKSIYFFHQSYNKKLMFSKDLYKTVATDFLKLKPIYDFFVKVSMLK